MKYYAGLDISNEDTSICIVDQGNNIRLLSKLALLEKTIHFYTDLPSNFSGISEDMAEKLDGKDVKNDCFNEQMEFRKGSIVKEAKVTSRSKRKTLKLKLIDENKYLRYHRKKL